MAKKTFAPLVLTLLVLGIPAYGAITGGGCKMEWHLDYILGGDPPLQYYIPDAYLTLECPETSWQVHVRNTDRGLQVGPVFLSRKPGDSLMVLKLANIAENLTLYHDGSTRLNDSQFGDFYNAIPKLNASDLDANGMLVATGFYDFLEPRAAAELRSYGFAWFCTWGLTDSISRRGMEMVIWGVWDTGNYDYIIEYTFRDDGRISFRVGATGWNNPKDVSSDTAHTHDILWRVDINLGSGQRNTARVWSHQETSLSAVDSDVLFNNGREGAMDLDDLHFATLVIEDDDPATKNAHNHRIGYELHILKDGAGRHYGGNEQWTQHDVWVTQFSQAEDHVTFATGDDWRPADTYLLGNSGNNFGVFNQDRTFSTDLVVWPVTTAHHEPHDEDQAASDPGLLYKGITLIHWSGFDLIPRNLFDMNPLGAPHRQTCNGPAVTTPPAK